MGKNRTEPKVYYEGVVIHSDDPSDKFGVEVSLNMESAWRRILRFNVHQLDWSDMAREYYGHNLWVDMTITSYTATKKLMSAMHAATPDELIRKMARRFSRYGSDSFGKIRGFFDAKGIEYDYHVQ